MIPSNGKSKRRFAAFAIYHLSLLGFCHLLTKIIKIPNFSLKYGFSSFLDVVNRQNLGSY